MVQGFMYLIAMIDLKSRYVLNWSESNTKDTEWCDEVFREAVRKHRAPEILNTDPGAQFTSEVFTRAVIEEIGTKSSPWTASVGQSTTSSSNGYGEASN
jgi:putative transposase